jgi:hypothetical protein
MMSGVLMAVAALACTGFGGAGRGCNNRGCNSDAENACDTLCGCTGCDTEQCVAQMEALEEDAGEAGCEGQYEAYAQCLETNTDCDIYGTDTFADVCQSERASLDECRGR